MQARDPIELLIAERVVREGSMQVARQRAFVLGLDPRSDEAGVARSLLHSLEEAQVHHVAHLARVRASA